VTAQSGDGARPGRRFRRDALARWAHVIFHLSEGRDPDALVIHCSGWCTAGAGAFRPGRPVSDLAGWP